MTPILVTRFHGHRVIIQHLPTGVGTDVWCGEFRTNEDIPYRTKNGVPENMRSSADLTELLEALRKMSRSVRHYPVTREALRQRRRKAKKRASGGHPKGTNPTEAA